MYRDDTAARVERANTLIDEIAGIERKKLGQAEMDRRLEEARRELAVLQERAPAQAVRSPGLVAHALVFAATAAAAFLAYTLLT